MIWLSLALAAVPTGLVPMGSSWKYLDNGVIAPSHWTELSFDDSGWAVGNAPLGYGTFVATTINPAGQTTTYYRQEFSATLANVDSLTLSSRHDDGVVVYLNGVEIYRDNLPPGLVGAHTLATASVAGLAQNNVKTISIDDSLLLEGDNLLAVELHQDGGVVDGLVDVNLTSYQGDPLVTRGPYLQNGAPGEVTVRWRTDAPSDSVVWWGDSVGNLVNSTSGSLEQLDHEVVVQDLDDGADLIYGVGFNSTLLVGDDLSHVLPVPPAVGVPTPVRIWAIGDSGTANISAEAVRDGYLSFAAGVAPDVWLMLGDNAYNSGTDTEYQAAVFDTYPDLLSRSLLWATLGNHDGYSADSVTETGPYYEIFTLPSDGRAGGVVSGTEAYYSFDYANIHFVCLDSYGSDRSDTSAQWLWLEEDLASTDQDWVIAFFHHPPYTKGSHDSDREIELIEMRANAVSRLEASGVDLVLSGHSHSYERSYFIDSHYGMSDDFDRAHLRAEGGDGYIKPTVGSGANEGAVFVVAGASGKISGGLLNHSAMFTSLNELGSMVIDVDDLSLTASYLDVYGGVLDSFSIEKGHTSVLVMLGEEAVEEGVSLSFEAYAQDPTGAEVLTYQWDFGDTTVGSGASVSHFWTAEGTYDVTVSGIDSAGGFADRTMTVVVQNGPPIIDAAVSSGGVKGEAVYFWSVSHDPGLDPITVQWDFGDGAVGFGDEVSHVYDADGTYTATLTVTDDEGAAAISTLTVLVTNPAPIIDRIEVPAAFEGTPAIYYAVPEDPSLFLTWVWDMGDGTAPITGPLISHIYVTDGTFEGTLTVTDSTGATASSPFTVVVSNSAPVVDQVFLPSGGEGQPLVFEAIVHDPGGDEVSIAWEFEGAPAPLLGARVVYAFDNDGSRSATLRLMDSQGAFTTQYYIVDIHNLPPKMETLQLPSVIYEGEPARYTATGSDPGAADLVSVSWVAPDGGQLYGESVDMTFRDDGPRVLEISFTDDDFVKTTIHVPVVVENKAPKLINGPPVLARIGELWRFTPIFEDVAGDTITWEWSGVGERVAESVDYQPLEIDIGRTFSAALIVSDEDGGVATYLYDVGVVGVSEVLTPSEPTACGCSSSRVELSWVVVLPVFLGWRRRKYRLKRGKQQGVGSREA